MADGRQMTRRIALDDEQFDAIREFKEGLSSHYADAIRVLLAEVCEDGESPFMAGHRLRSALHPELSDD